VLVAAETAAGTDAVVVADAAFAFCAIFSPLAPQSRGRSQRAPIGAVRISAVARGFNDKTL
jgi:hypothetical protein